MMPFYERLRLLMTERGITQAELSRRVGTNRSTVNQWWWGSSMPNLESLTKIRRAIGCSWDDLLSGVVPW